MNDWDIKNVEMKDGFGRIGVGRDGGGDCIKLLEIVVFKVC